VLYVEGPCRLTRGSHHGPSQPPGPEFRCPRSRTLCTRLVRSTAHARLADPTFDEYWLRTGDARCGWHDELPVQPPAHPRAARTGSRTYDSAAAVRLTHPRTTRGAAVPAPSVVQNLLQKNPSSVRVHGLAGAQPSAAGLARCSSDRGRTGWGRLFSERSHEFSRLRLGGIAAPCAPTAW